MRFCKLLGVILVCCVTAMTAHAQPEAAKRYGGTGAARHLLVRGTTDIALFDRLLHRFVQIEPRVSVVYEQWSSNDLFSVTHEDCQRGIAGTDMVISSAVDLQVKLVNDGCAQSYRSTLTEALPDAQNWRDEVFGISREPAVFVYNRRLVPDTEVPRSRFDLIDLLRPAESRYAGRVATYDIEDSGLGYLFAFQDSQQATTYGSLIEAFERTGAIATCCSAEIIDGVVSGQYLIAYNVLGSYALARAGENPELVVVAPEDYTLVLSRAALIPRRANDPDLAGRFLDFMLSDPGRRIMASARLIVDFTEPDPDPDAFFFPMGNRSAFRPIPLSPVLLVGLDQHKRQLFLDRWRAAFGEATLPAPSETGR